MSKLNKTIMFGAKIFEIAVWIYLAITLATAIAFIINSPEFFLTKVLQNKETHFAYGFFGSSLSVSGEKLIFMRKAYGIIKLTHIASITFIALISRNIFLIFKTTEGKTKFSKGATPFQPRNIKMIKEIGYFYIAAPLVQSALNLIAAMFLKKLYGDELSLELQCDLARFVYGLIILCIAQFFAYGMKLEDDIEGLV